MKINCGAKIIRKSCSAVNPLAISICGFNFTFYLFYVKQIFLFNTQDISIHEITK